MTTTNVGILIFDGVEVLDFAGPFEVFSRARLTPGVESRRSDDAAPFNVFTVAKYHDEVVATGGLRVMPEYSFSDAPAIDLLLVPGGFGTRPLLEDAETLEWIRDTASRASRITSVCTGALLLAKIGLLEKRRATTHWSALDLLKSIEPTATIESEPRFVDDGVVSSAGVSAGIDMALHVVAQMHGEAVAKDTARYMDYRAAVGPAVPG